MTGEKMKRHKAPRFYPIPRKIHKWTIHPSPGPHPIDESLPLAILLREVLGYASNLREVKYILNKGYVRVDGRIIKDYRFPVGLMDVVELIPEERFFRMLPTEKMNVYPFEIDMEESRIKPCRVKVKKSVKGGVFQLSFHDGRSMLEDNLEKACRIKPGDTLIFNIHEKTFTEHIPLKEGVMGLVIKGKAAGVYGRIMEIAHPDRLRPKIVYIEVNGRKIQTIKDYVFPIGVEKPVIALPEVEK